ARAPASSTARARAPRSRRAPGGPPGRASARRGGSLELLAHDARALDERAELLPHEPARRLPEAAVGVEPELVGGHVLEQPPDALGHLVGVSARNAFTSMT